MSFSGNPEPTGGSPDVPAEGVPSQSQEQVSPNDPNAAMPQPGSPEGAGTQEGAPQDGLPDIDDETLQRIAREKGFYTKDDFSRATSTLMRRENEARRQAEQANQQIAYAQARAQHLESLARENLNEEDIENALLKFDRDQQEAAQTQQQEAQQLEGRMEQDAISRVQSWVRDAAYDDQGQQIFDPNDKEILDAARVFVQWSKYGAIHTDENTAAQWDNAGRYLRRLLFNKARTSGMAGQQAQPQPEQQQAPPQQNSRGRQVTAPRGGGGQPGVKETYQQARESGSNADEAFTETLKSFMAQRAAAS